MVHIARHPNSPRTLVMPIMLPNRGKMKATGRVGDALLYMSSKVGPASRDAYQNAVLGIARR